MVGPPAAAHPWFRHYAWHCGRRHSRRLQAHACRLLARQRMLQIPHNPPPTHPLQVENVECIAPNQIKFDFLGKDSIRYENTVEVSGRRSCR